MVLNASITNAPAVCVNLKFAVEEREYLPKKTDRTAKSSMNMYTFGSMVPGWGTWNGLWTPSIVVATREEANGVRGHEGMERRCWTCGAEV